MIVDVRSPRRWARPGVQGRWEHILSTLYATCAYLVDWNGLSVFTLDDSDKVLPFGSSFIELCTSPIQLQHTDEHTDSSWHYPLSSAVPPSSSPSTVYTTTSPNHILPPHLRSYAPSIQNKPQEPGVTGFHTSFFIIKNTTWLDRDLLHLPVLTMATPTGKYSSQLEIIEYLSR